jgi:hypothetical protein
VEQEPKPSPLKRIYSAADEEAILDEASRRLHQNRADLILVAGREGLVIQNKATQECWRIEQLNRLPKIEPAN